MKTIQTIALTLIAILLASYSWGDPPQNEDVIIYSSIRELQGSNTAGTVIIVRSNSASFWMDEPGYPLQGFATRTETNLVIHYPTKNYTQHWKIMTINGREWLFGSVALQHYEKEQIIAPFDAIVRLTGSETTNSVPRATDLGVKAWEQKK